MKAGRCCQVNAILSTKPIAYVPTDLRFTRNGYFKNFKEKTVLTVMKHLVSSV